MSAIYPWRGQGILVYQFESHSALSHRETWKHAREVADKSFGWIEKMKWDSGAEHWTVYVLHFGYHVLF